MRQRNDKLPTYFLPAFIAFLAVMGTLFSYFTYRSWVAPADKNNEEMRNFIVEKGDSTKLIASKLAGVGLIRSPFGFRVVVKLSGLAGKLQAGVYELAPSMSTATIASELTDGHDTQLTFLIPEGFRIEQIAARAQESLNIPAKDFIAAAKGQEGYLFPAKYYFAAGTTADQVVKRMRNTFTQNTDTLTVSPDAVIIASLLEKETKGDDEKPVVAGILKKRMANGWPLQLDATISYIAGSSKEWWPETTVADRKRPSVYNTYLHPGLPPAPICNPGLAAIKAAITPQDSPYWFYLHDKQGVIHYAATDAEQQANIVKYIY